MEKKVLKKERFEQVIAVLKEQNQKDLVQFMQDELTRHLNRAERAKERAAKKKKEADELISYVRDAVATLTAGGDKAATRDAITKVVEQNYDGEIEITPAKVGARLNILVNDGEVMKEKATVDKARKMVYSIIEDEEDVDTENEEVVETETDTEDEESAEVEEVVETESDVDVEE